MGTNYYWHENAKCECCGRSYKPLHIGESSAGWCFSLHVIPELGINDLDDWRKRWKRPNTFIRNQYGETITPEGMDRIITKRTGNLDVGWEERFASSESTFHRENHSQRGPYGLVRHELGRYCVKHGDGTWDCIPGEFS